MRIDWNQSLEGLSMLEIRNLLRVIGPQRRFDAEYLAQRIAKQHYASPAKVAFAQRLILHLVRSELIELDCDGQERSCGLFMLSDAGMSLCAASATKRFKRARAEKAIPRLLEVVERINSDPIFMHDVVWLAVYGSYLTEQPELGDIDIAYELRGRWTPGIKGDESYKSRKEAFEAVHVPPESFYERAFWRSWPEEFTKRLLRVDRAINLTERSTMERLGCAYRIILPEEKAVPAKPDWSSDRTEIVLREDDGTAARLIETASQS